MGSKGVVSKETLDVSLGIGVNFKSLQKIEFIIFLNIWDALFIKFLPREEYPITWNPD